MKIGFIGTGVMGAAMARNLMRAGHTLAVYNRTKSKALPLVEEGAELCETVAACAAGRDMVITIVGMPADVEQVYFAPDGILENADRGTLLVDMTTTEPSLSVRIHAAAVSRGLRAIDAPVSGGDVGAREGTLSIMAGGDEEDFEAAQPVLACMGSLVVYEGPAGSGQHTKMANQIAIAGAVAGVGEALSYARRMGLDLERTIQTLSAGAARSFQLESNGAKMVSGDMAPGFFIKHFVKDMGIAEREASDAGLSLEVLAQVLEMYRSLEARGLGELGTQAICKYYE
ncbi:NAD(P)-dependent oxidoreductase [Feifania hominis]|uniref:NAD(P)-dependent oxidoreductase n=1 Tax=Feifania hominis TaxID=2763660 RepID=A0A926DGJ6_9FIRM|nr:NAD(P)-dependent oxidoreductase [Feifania hominis]MBC8536655.1 NAD(P)-dependent oxidoreductase [Feifania hominis]